MNATASHLNLIQSVLLAAGFHAQITRGGVQAKLSGHPVFTLDLIAVDEIGEMYDADLIDINSENGIAFIRVA